MRRREKGRLASSSLQATRLPQHAEKRSFRVGRKVENVMDPGLALATIESKPQPFHMGFVQRVAMTRKQRLSPARIYPWSGKDCRGSLIRLVMSFWRI